MFAIEALKDSLRQKKATVNEIYRYAKICRVSNVIRPYMEALASASQPGTSQLQYAHVCHIGPREAKITREFSEDTRSSASKMVWDAQPSCDKFVLKEQRCLRSDRRSPPTCIKDFDLLGKGSSAIGEVEETIRTICVLEENDGILSGEQTGPRNANQRRGGIRGCPRKFSTPTWQALGYQCRSISDLRDLQSIQSRNLLPFPVLLPMEALLIPAYPREAAIAEKFNAMVVLDIRNSRM